MSEEWRAVEGFEGVYDVSDLGRVRRRHRTKRARVLKPWTHTKYGHLQVGLYQNAQRLATPTVHALVLAAFVGPRPDGYEIRHLNGDPSDNRVSNLAYGTKLENAADMRLHGTHNNGKKTHCKRGHEFTAENTRVYNGKRTCRKCETAGQRTRRGSSVRCERHGRAADCGCVGCRNRLTAQANVPAPGDDNGYARGTSKDEPQPRFWRSAAGALTDQPAKEVIG